MKADKIPIEKRIENRFELISYMNQFHEQGISFDFYIDNSYIITQEDINKLKLSEHNKAAYEGLEGKKRVVYDIIKTNPERQSLEAFYSALRKKESARNENDFIEKQIKILNAIDDQIKDEYEFMFFPLLDFFKEKLMAVNATKNELPIQNMPPPQDTERYQSLISKMQRFLNTTKALCDNIDKAKAIKDNEGIAFNKNKLIEFYEKQIVMNSELKLDGLVEGAILDLKKSLFSPNNNAEILRKDIKIEIKKILKTSKEYEQKYNLNIENDEFGIGNYFRDVLAYFNEFVDWVNDRDVTTIQKEKAEIMLNKETIHSNLPIEIHEINKFKFFPTKVQNSVFDIKGKKENLTIQLSNCKLILDKKSVIDEEKRLIKNEYKPNMEGAIDEPIRIKDIGSDVFIVGTNEWNREPNYLTIIDREKLFNNFQRGKKSAEIIKEYKDKNNDRVSLTEKEKAEIIWIETVYQYWVWLNNIDINSRNIDTQLKKKSFNFKQEFVKDIDELFDKMKGVFISERTDLEQFKKVFTNVPLSEIQIIEWIAASSLLAYFLRKVEGIKLHKYNKEDLWATAKKCFTKSNNLKQLEVNYQNSKTGLPKNSDTIDKLF